MLRRQCRSWRLELEATQGGAGIPPVLLRLQTSCGGRGSITGPRRGYLYYWRASSRADVEGVIRTIGPWMGEPKRSQLASALRTAERSTSLPSLDRTPIAELAWAAGLYGGDGTTSAGRNKAGGPTYRTLKAGLPQAAVNGGVPPVLPRFQAAVGGIGSVKGPYVLKNPWSRLPQYRWSIQGIRGVEPVLEQIWPWLDDAKRDQARAAIRAARAAPHRPVPPVSEVFELE